MKCKNCGKEAPKYLNYCDWNCSVEAAIKDGGKIYTPNNLPINSINCNGMLLECEHGDHPDYKFPVKVVRNKNIYNMEDTPKEDLDVDAEKLIEIHALIYTDDNIALTMYECCYFIFSLSSGNSLRGFSYSKYYSICEEDLVKIREFAERKRNATK